MTDDQVDELLSYARDLTGAMVSIAKTMEMEYNRKYPTKPPPRDVDITYQKTEEELLREEQGQTGEQTLTDWTSLGPRERAFLKKESTTTKG